MFFNIFLVVRLLLSSKVASFNCGDHDHGRSKRPTITTVRIIRADRYWTSPSLHFTSRINKSRNARLLLHATEGIAIKMAVFLNWHTVNEFRRIGRRNLLNTQKANNLFVINQQVYPRISVYLNLYICNRESAISD